MDQTALAALAGEIADAMMVEYDRRFPAQPSDQLSADTRDEIASLKYDRMPGRGGPTGLDVTIEYTEQPAQSQEALRATLMPEQTETGRGARG